MATDGDTSAPPTMDPQVRDFLFWAGRILYWIVVPIALAIYYVLYYLFLTLLSILQLLYRPLEFIALPFIYLGQFLIYCLLAPFYFLARFETLYIYLGIAALVGCALGLVLAFIYGSLQGPLGLDAPPVPHVRTAKEYRREKRKKKARDEAPLLSPGPAYLSAANLSLSDSGRKRRREKQILSPAIMEQLDSDY